MIFSSDTCPRCDGFSESDIYSNISGIYSKDILGILIAWELILHAPTSYVAMRTHSLVVGHIRDSLSVPSGHPSESSWSDGIDSTVKARSGRRELLPRRRCHCRHEGKMFATSKSGERNTSRHMRETWVSWSLFLSLSFLSLAPLRQVLHHLRISACRRSNSAWFRARTRATSVNQ